MNKLIPFNKPRISKREIENIKKLNIKSNFSGNGEFTKQCASWLVENTKCKEALLVKSCTAALEMCAILLDIKHKDEIIMPSYTFVSTANAFAMRGGCPVFVDIDKKTLCIDPNKIEKNINKNTKAIVVVHYAGVSPNMNQILKIAKKYNLYIIEDAAHGILCNYKKKALGSIGDLATISFHETKNIHCGEGGALLINNPKFIKKARIIKDKGTNRDDFNKNIVKKYTWVNIGSSYNLSEINSSILIEQLKRSKETINNRMKIWRLYHKELKQLETLKKLIRPDIPKYSKINGHIYYIIVDKKKRLKLINYLKKSKIISTFHYVPLHNSPFALKSYKTIKRLNNTEDISETIVRLPFYNEIKQKNVIYITKKIKQFFNEEN